MVEQVLYRQRRHEMARRVQAPHCEVPSQIKDVPRRIGSCQGVLPRAHVGPAKGSRGSCQGLTLGPAKGSQAHWVLPWFNNNIVLCQMLRMVGGSLHTANGDELRAHSARAPSARLGSADAPTPPSTGSWRACRAIPPRRAEDARLQPARGPRAVHPAGRHVRALPRKVQAQYPRGCLAVVSGRR
jgi:hypothetical protein